MTKALDGLRLGASSKTVAFAELSGDQIMSNMSDDQKAAVAAALAPAKAEEPAKPGEAAPEPAKGDEVAGKGKEQQEAPKGDAADPAHAQYAHGFNASLDRTKAVLTSEHYAGREKAAATMLGNAKMSADEIVSTLADLPKGAAAADGMLSSLASAANPDLKPGTEANGTGAAAEAKGVWDRVAENQGWAAK